MPRPNNAPQTATQTPLPPCPEVGRAYVGPDGVTRWVVLKSKRGIYSCLWHDPTGNRWFNGGGYRAEQFPMGPEVRAPQPGETYVRVGVYGVPDTYTVQGPVTGTLPPQRIPPDLSLPDPIPGVVFVFGSNARGYHGKGAAADAVRHYGAIMNKYAGRQGMAYAIPTKDLGFQPVFSHELRIAIAEFIGYAKEADITPGYTDLWFLVTRVGCGYARFDDSEVAPMFADAPLNCILPEVWSPYLPAATRNGRLFHKRDGGK